LGEWEGLYKIDKTINVVNNSFVKTTPIDNVIILDYGSSMN